MTVTAADCEGLSDHEMRNELARLRALLEGRWKDAVELSLMSARPMPDGAFGFDLRGGLVPLVAEHLAQAFKGMGGENYVQIEVNHEEIGPLTLTMQRRFGETPAAQNSRLRAEVEKLTGERDAAVNIGGVALIKLGTANRLRATAEANCDWLQTVLKPFAEYGRVLTDPENSNPISICTAAGQATVTPLQFRSAYAAITEPPVFDLIDNKLVPETLL